MAKIVQFDEGNGAVVAVNPAYVVQVRPLHDNEKTGSPQTRIELAGNKGVSVQGALSDVLKKLNG